MITTSQQQQKASQNEQEDAWKGDYPSSGTISLASLERIVVTANRFKPKGHSLELLVIISNRWISRHESSTVYKLSNGDTKNIMCTYQKVERLRNAGLIEVVGTGRYNSKSYGPTASGLAVLAPLCNVA